MTPLLPAALLYLLGAALVVRLGLVWATTGVGVEIVDEQHYATLAYNLISGLGFAWEPGRLTSLRPPLFPAFVSLVWALTVPESVTAVRLAQIPVSLLTVWLVYLIGAQVYSRRIGLVAAGIVAFYPTLLFSGLLVLSETLFTLLLLLTVFCCLMLFRQPSWWLALLAGASLGITALTRSIMWPSIALLAVGVLAGLVPERRLRWRMAVLLVAGYGLTVGPWSYRNTQLQGTFTVVDTMGGQNLMLGNYAYTPEDRMWDAISLSGDERWDHAAPKRAPDGRRWTEGGLEKWARQQAFDYMLANPGTTLRRMVLKFADFWGIEREFVAGVGQGLYRPPMPVFLLTAAAIAGVYALVMIASALGVCLARPASRRDEILLVGIVLFMAGVHAVVFGHSRYHLPAVPILALFAAAAIDGRVWKKPAAWTARLSAATMVVLIGLIWVRDVFIRDADRLASLAARLGLGG